MKEPPPALELARQALVRRPSGLFTDVDGTISPIVARPEDAAVPARARRALRRLQARLDLVAVVSGRSASEARRMVRLAGIVYVGNHGLEWRRGRTHVVTPAALPYRSTVRACLGGIGRRVLVSGIRLENKGASGAVHFRMTDDPPAVHEEILAAMEELPACQALRPMDGRMVVNLLPPLPADKGTAIRALAEEYGLSGLVYLGDDVTDLDAFRALAELREAGCATAAIAVESPEAPTELRVEADATLPSVDAVYDLLEALSIDFPAVDPTDPS